MGEIIEDFIEEFDHDGKIYAVEINKIGGIIIGVAIYEDVGTQKNGRKNYQLQWESKAKI